MASVPTYHFQLTLKNYATCTLLGKLYDFALVGKKQIKKIYQHMFTASSRYQKTDTQPWVNISMIFYDSLESSLVNRTRKEDNVKN